MNPLLPATPRRWTTNTLSPHGTPIHAHPSPQHAEARAASNRQERERTASPPPKDEEALHNERKEWLKFIDGQIKEKASKAQAVKTLEILLQLVENVLNPNEDEEVAEKQRKVRARNKLIKANIIDIPGALDFFVAGCFRRTVIDMEEFYIFPAAPLPRTRDRLTVAHSVLQTSLLRSRIAHEEEVELIRMAEEEKAKRWKNAMADAAEDRMKQREREGRKKEKKEREKAKGKTEERKRKEDNLRAPLEGHNFDRA